MTPLIAAVKYTIHFFVIRRKVGLTQNTANKRNFDFARHRLLSNVKCQK